MMELGQEGLDRIKFSSRFRFLFFFFFFFFVCLFVCLFLWPQTCGSFQNVANWKIAIMRIRAVFHELVLFFYVRGMPRKYFSNELDMFPS